MVETTVKDVDVSAQFGKLIAMIFRNVGRNGDVARCRNHNFHLHPALERTLKGAHHLWSKGEVRVNELHAVLCIVENLDKSLLHNACRLARNAIDYAHLLPARSGGGVGLESGEIVLRATKSGIIFHALQALARHFVPEVYKHLLQFGHSISLDATMQVAPRAKLGFAHHVVVRHIHSAGVGNESVNYNDLSVVAVKTILHVGKTYAVELQDLDATTVERV